MPQLGLLFIPMTYFVIVGSSNAVNLTDGLDGLAIMPTVMVASGLALVAWATGNVHYASYLHIPYIQHASELVIVCTSIVGAGLGFCGLTRILLSFLWVMSAPWLWVLRWVFWRCLYARSFYL